MRIHNLLTKSILFGLIAFTFLGATERFKEELFKAMKYRNIGALIKKRIPDSRGISW